MPRPQQHPPYEKPAPKPTVLRQSMMPYFTTVKGEFTQLCVSAAQDKPCPDPKCKFSHVPKSERPCPAFHTPKEKCPFDARCLLGHAEAREAVKQSKAFAKHKEWQSQIKTTPGTYGETDAAESGTELPKTSAQPTGPTLGPNAEPANQPLANPALNLTPDVAVKLLTATETIPTQKPDNLPDNPAVNFQTLAQTNAKRGQGERVPPPYPTDPIPAYRRREAEESPNGEGHRHAYAPDGDGCHASGEQRAP